MIEFHQILQEIEKQYGQLDNDSRKQLAGLMSAINRYVIMNPEADKLKIVRNSIDRKLRQEIAKPLGSDRMVFWSLQRLRNQIIHNQKIDNSILQDFGSWMWNKFSDVYQNEPLSLYNTLMYVIRPESDLRITPGSADQTALFFYNIYKSKEESERTVILRKLIPLVTPKFKAKYGTKKRNNYEDSL